MAEFFSANWEWCVLAFMVCEKIVKMSPTDKDDIMLDIVWSSIKKVVGKK